MSKTVFILGAGASVTAGVPTMAEFMDKVEELRADSHSGVTTSAFDLFSHVRHERLTQLHSKSVVDLDNIESIFGIVEMGDLLGRLPGTSPNEIGGVVEATRRVLAETIELSCHFQARMDRWFPPEDYLRLVLWLKDAVLAFQPRTVTLISFNYDIALDYALFFSDVQYTYCLEEAPPAVLPYLKLHGSLNWAGPCAKCGSVRAVPIERVFELDRVRPVDGKSRVLRATQALSSLGACCGEANSYEPAIVPPSWNKTRYHRSFGRVWRRGAQALAEAEEIFVIGYSMPPTDTFFRDLLALGLAGPTRHKKIEVIDPKIDVAKRLREMLGPEVRNRVAPQQNNFLSWSRQLPQSSEIALMLQSRIMPDAQDARRFRG